MLLSNSLKKIIKGIISWANNEQNSKHYPEPEPIYSTSKNMVGSSHSHGHIGDRGLNLSVYSAIGGKVVKVHQHNVFQDVKPSSLYVITDREDLGTELGLIITRESLSN